MSKNVLPLKCLTHATNKVKKLSFVTNVKTVIMICLFAMSVHVFAQTSYKFDFGTGPVKPGYTQVQATTTYSSSRGYGFDFNVQVSCLDQGGTDSLTRDNCFRNGFFYFSMNLPEGNYTVTTVLGDPKIATTTTIKAETRRLMVEKVSLAAGEFSTQTFTVNRRNTAISTGGSVGVTSRELGGLNWDGDKLTLEFNNTHPSIASLEVAPANNPRQLFLAGNSTQCDWATETEAAWGQMFPRFFKSTAVVIGMAESGLTTASFLAQKRLDKILSLIHDGDYVFVEFGHNDMGSLSLSEYKTNLGTFITKVKAAKGIPVLVTPTARRQFTGTKANNSFVNGNGDYVAAMKDVATSNNALLIDLNAMTMKFIEALGPTNSAKAYWYHETTQDNTHFNDYGAYEVAKMVTEGVRTGIPELLPYLAADVKPFNPATPDSPDTLKIPVSADTSIWHYHGKVNIETTPVLPTNITNNLLSIHPSTAQICYTISEPALAHFTLYSVDGRELAKKNVMLTETQASLFWDKLGKLPLGIYYVSMTIGNNFHTKTVFCAL